MISRPLILGFFTLLVKVINNLPSVISTGTVSTYALSAPPALTQTSKSLNSRPCLLKEKTRWSVPEMPLIDFREMKFYDKFSVGPQPGKRIHGVTLRPVDSQFLGVCDTQIRPFSGIPRR